MYLPMSDQPDVLRRCTILQALQDEQFRLLQKSTVRPAMGGGNHKQKVTCKGTFLISKKLTQICVLFTHG